MGTITQRRKADGTLRYTAQIRIRRQGEIVYQQTQTFSKKAAAQAWIRKREAELDAPGALDAQINRKDVTVAEAINRYLEEYEAIRPLGRTKRLCLLALGKTALGQMQAHEVTSQTLIEYGQSRIHNDGITPQTLGNDLAHLSAVFSVAQPAWGYDLNPEEMRKARAVLKNLGAISRSGERTRRPTLEELDAILSYYEEMKSRRRQEIDMLRVIVFALFSTRRQDEITRISWDQVNEQDKTVLIKDMKNPGAKWGNDVWCWVPDEAWRVMQSAEKDGDRPFPYNGRSVSSSFTRACKFLEIEDLRFHDLRHEGISRLFEAGHDIPKVASASGHRDWNSMRRYTHLRGTGDKYADWPWVDRVINS